MAMRASIKAMNDYQAWENDGVEGGARKSVVAHRKNAVEWVKKLYEGRV